MKTKIIAAFAALGTFIGTLGDDVVKVGSGILKNQGDDVVRVGGRFLKNQGDDALTGARRIAQQQGDDALTGARRILKNQGDDALTGARRIAQQQGGIVVINPNVDIPQARKYAQEAVYTQVRNAISSEVNQKSTAELMRIARQANIEQSRKTGVLLNGVALGIVVSKAQE